MVAFIGVLLIILGGSIPVNALPGQDIPSEVKVKSMPQREAKWYQYVCLVAIPFIIAFHNIMMGEVRRLDPILIPFYTNFGIAILSLIVCWSSETGFSPSKADI